jgi:L-asparaginase
MGKLLFVFTGGTIAMKLDPGSGGAVPALSGAEILSFDPSLAQIAEIDVVDFAKIPGPHWTPQKMWELSELLREALRRADIIGAVVTHGTDTLEETAYLVDLRHASHKPVVFVGAMRNTSELSYDGPANLHAAARVAAAPESQKKGVLVVLNQTIHAASSATKTDTEQMETFQSPGFGPIGVVEPDLVIYYRLLSKRVTIDTPGLEPRVDLFKMYAGADGRFIDQAREQGARGIVVEGTGRGNVPPAAIDAIQRALDSGIPVVLASRCPTGRVLDTYAYEGSGRDLRRRGVIFGGSMNGQKARIRLMLALGRTGDLNYVRDLMEQDAY